MAAILTCRSRKIFRTRKVLYATARRNLTNLFCFKFETPALSQKMTLSKPNHLCFASQNRSISVNIPPDVIQESLSKSNRERIMKELEVMEKRQLLSCPEEAAVLVPFCTVDNKPSLLFTLRSSALVSHRGQVSFPGGKRDKEDKDLVETAIRETVEEIGINENIIDVWGTLPPMPNRKGKIAVTPVVSFLGEIDVGNIKYSHIEVSKVFHLTLEHILEHRRYTKFSNGVTMPVFINGPHLVWGMTATMMDVFFEIIFPGYYKKVFKISDRTKLPWLTKQNRKIINKVLNSENHTVGNTVNE